MVSPSSLSSAGRDRPDTDGMGTPAARLSEAAERYASAYAAARPGTSSEVHLVRARIDLTLLLMATGDVEPQLVEQLARDGEALLRTSPPLEV